MPNNEQEFRKQFICDFVSYMRDCSLTPKRACSYNYVVYALAASYRPLPAFWRQLNADLVEEAVKAYTLQDPLELHADLSEHTEWKQDVANHLFMHQHDELNAELLARIPLADRPSDEWAATEWICAELERRGDIENLEYAERDGHKCGRAALGHLRRLEAAANGKPAMTSDAWLAQDFRKQAMAGSLRQPNEGLEFNPNNFFRVFPDGRVEPMFPEGRNE